MLENDVVSGGRVTRQMIGMTTTGCVHKHTFTKRRKKEKQESMLMKEGVKHIPLGVLNVGWCGPWVRLVEGWEGFANSNIHVEGCD